MNIVAELNSNFGNAVGEVIDNGEGTDQLQDKIIKEHIFTADVTRNDKGLGLKLVDAVQINEELQGKIFSHFICFLSI